MSSAPLKIERPRVPGRRGNAKLAIVLIGLWLGVGVPFWIDFIAGDFHDVRRAVPPLVAWSIAGMLLVGWRSRSWYPTWSRWTMRLGCVASLGVLWAQAIFGFAENAALARFVRRNAAGLEELREALLMVPAGTTEIAKWSKANAILDRLGLEDKNISLGSDSRGMHFTLILERTTQLFISPWICYKGICAFVPHAQRKGDDSESDAFEPREAIHMEPLGTVLPSVELFRIVIES